MKAVNKAFRPLNYLISNKVPLPDLLKPKIASDTQGKVVLNLIIE
jgi:hypothetical protein